MDITSHNDIWDIISSYGVYNLHQVCKLWRNHIQKRNRSILDGLYSLYPHAKNLYLLVRTILEKNDINSMRKILYEYIGYLPIFWDDMSQWVRTDTLAKILIPKVKYQTSIDRLNMVIEMETSKNLGKYLKQICSLSRIDLLKKYTGTDNMYDYISSSLYPADLLKYVSTDHEVYRDILVDNAEGFNNDSDEVADEDTIIVIAGATNILKKRLPSGFDVHSAIGTGYIPNDMLEFLIKDYALLDIMESMHEEHKDQVLHLIPLVLYNRLDLDNRAMKILIEESLLSKRNRVRGESCNSPHSYDLDIIECYINEDNYMEISILMSQGEMDIPEKYFSYLARKGLRPEWISYLIRNNTIPVSWMKKPPIEYTILFLENLLKHDGVDSLISAIIRDYKYDLSPEHLQHIADTASQYDRTYIIESILLKSNMQEQYSTIKWIRMEDILFQEITTILQIFHTLRWNTSDTHTILWIESDPISQENVQSILKSNRIKYDENNSPMWDISRKIGPYTITVEYSDRLELIVTSSRKYHSERNKSISKILKDRLNPILPNI